MPELTLLPHQENFLEAVPTLANPARACLYFKTGSGKSLSAVRGMAALGVTEALVIGPPSTHAQWEALARTEGLKIQTMSHAKFRMKGTKLSRTTAVIADEFHMFGGQQGQGWRKLDTLARHLQAPLFLLSATPNYNDAERVYCIQHVLDPLSCRGGFLEFLYKHCETAHNPFSQTPNVLGFRNHKSAAEYLAALPNVFHLPDDLVYTIKDIPYYEDIPDELVDFGYNRRDHKMVASQIEMTHTVRYQGMVGEDGYIHTTLFEDTILNCVFGAEPVLIYVNHATIAEALSRSMSRAGVNHACVTGKTSKKDKERVLQEFLSGRHQVLIGTATLATGTDGMDRVCDTLLILDDTEDDALRRQLVGRIMPRGDFVSTAAKQVIRLKPIS
ncbi:MAG: DEAD/DEAH box helicase [Azonexus sp.]